MKNFETDLNELVFNRHRDKESQIKTLKSRIREKENEMRLLRISLVNSRHVTKAKLDEYSRLNEQLKALKDKESWLTYLRNQV